MAQGRKSIKIDIKLPSKAEANKQLSSLIEQLNKSTSGIKLDLDISSFNKSLGDMSKLLSNLKGQLGKFGILENVVNNDSISKQTSVLKEQEKIARERINLAKMLAKEEVDSRNASQSKVKSLMEEINIMQTKLNTSKSNSLIDTTVLEKLQTKLNNITTDTPKNEILELQAVIKNLSSSDSNIVRLQNNISKLENSMVGLKGKYGALVGDKDSITQLKAYEEQLVKLKSTLNNITENGTIVDGKKISSEINSANNSFKSLETSVKNSSNALKLSQKDAISFGSALKDVATKVGLFSVVYTAINSLRQGFREGVQSVIAMDTALYDLNKVVDITKQQMAEMRDIAVSMGKELGKSSVEIAQAQAEFGRMYKNLDQINELTKISTIGANTMGIDSGAVAKGLTTVMSAMNMEASDAMKILDSMNEIQNNYRIESKNLLDALSEVGSVAYTSGAELEKVQGYITAISVATGESGSEVGNALKSIMSRVYKIGSEGLESEGKPEQMLKDMGVAVRDAQGNFRDFSTILDDLNVKWKTMSNTEKIATAQTVAGVHRYNSFMALMNNYQVAVDATSTSLASQGSALKENEVYLQSAEAKLGTLKATNEEFMYSFINSDMLKGGIDALTGLVSVLTKAQNTFGSLGMSVGTLSSAFLMFTNNPVKKLASDMLTTDKTMKVLVKDMLGINTSTATASGGVKALGVSFDVVKIKALALQAVLSIGIGLAIGVAVKAVAVLIDKFEDWYNASEKVEDMSNKLSETLRNIEVADNLSSEYEKLNEKLKESNLLLEEQTDINKRIVDIRNELSNDEEFKNILDNQNLTLETQLGLIQAINEERKYDDAKKLEKQMTKGGVFSNETKSETSYNELIQYIEQYKELMALQKANQGESIVFGGTTYDLKSQNALIKEYESSIREAYISVQQWNSDVDKVESALGKTDLELINVSSDVDDFMNSFLNLNETTDDSANSIDGYGDSLTDLQGDIQTTADKLKGMANEFDSLGGQIDILSKALDEFSENGILSRDTASKILNSGDSSLISLLNDQNSFLEKGNELLGVKQQLQQDTLNNAIDLANTEMGLSNQVAQTFTEDELVKINSALQANKSIVESTAEATSINLKNYNIDSENKVLAEMAKLKSVSAFVNSNDEATASMVNQLADKYGIDVENYKNSINEKIRLLNSWIHTATYDINRVVQASGKSLWTNNPYKDQMELAEKYASTVSSAYNKISASGGKVGIGDIGSSGSGGKGSGSSSAQKQQEDIESLTDRYYILQNALTDVENALKSLDTKMENATEEEKIKLLDQEIALLNKKRKALNDIWYEQKQEKNDLQYTLSQNGFQFDSEGNITNYKKRLNELLAWANSQSDAEAKKSAQDTYKNLVKIVDDYTKLIKDSIPDTINQFDDITNAIIDSQKEISDILQKQREEYVKNLEKETDALKNELQKRKDLINKQWETEDEEDERAEKQDKINQLEADLASAMRSGNEALQKSIRDQLEKAQQELNKFITESERETINNRFDEEMNKLDEDLQNKIDMIESQLGDEDLLSLVQSGVRDLSSALNNIDSSTKNVNRSFAYVGDTVNNIGDIIGNTWGNNLDKVIEKAKELVGVLSSDLSLNTNNIPTAKASNGGSTIQVDVGDINIPGLTKDEFSREWDKKGDELYNEIMKQFNR